MRMVSGKTPGSSPTCLSSPIHPAHAHLIMHLVVVGRAMGHSLGLRPYLFEDDWARKHGGIYITVPDSENASKARICPAPPSLQ